MPGATEICSVLANRWRVISSVNELEKGRWGDRMIGRMGEKVKEENEMQQKWG